LDLLCAPVANQSEKRSRGSRHHKECEVQSGHAGHRAGAGNGGVPGGDHDYANPAQMQAGGDAR
jgi:hypothetical protein